MIFQETELQNFKASSSVINELFGQTTSFYNWKHEEKWLKF